jgi:small basic protein (TIGR04137 family)
MSIHPSLGAAAKGKQAKSVLKRSERIKHMFAKGLWKDESAKAFGLPKIKALRVKMKKEKVEKAAEGDAAAAGATPAAAPAADTKAKAAPKK